jgi:hypothetical protein
MSDLRVLLTEFHCCGLSVRIHWDHGMLGVVAPNDRRACLGSRDEREQVEEARGTPQNLA